MTYEGLVASLVWSGVTAYGLWRADLLAARMLAAQERAGDDANAIRRATNAKPNRAQVELPDDLNAVALQESELWAQDSMRQVMIEKFLEFHTGDSAETWQKVRRAVGVGELP